MIYFSSLLRYYKLLVAGQATDKVKLAFRLGTGVRRPTVRYG
jgi:hypothetical protein